MLCCFKVFFSLTKSVWFSFERCSVISFVVSKAWLNFSFGFSLLFLDYSAMRYSIPGLATSEKQSVGLSSISPWCSVWYSVLWCIDWNISKSKRALAAKPLNWSWNVTPFYKLEYMIFHHILLDLASKFGMGPRRGFLAPNILYSDF